LESYPDVRDGLSVNNEHRGDTIFGEVRLVKLIVLHVAKKIPCRLWNRGVNHRLHNIPPLILIVIDPDVCSQHFLTLFV